MFSNLIFFSLNHSTPVSGLAWDSTSEKLILQKDEKRLTAGPSHAELSSFCDGSWAISHVSAVSFGELQEKPGDLKLCFPAQRHSAVSRVPSTPFSQSLCRNTQAKFTGQQMFLKL